MARGRVAATSHVRVVALVQKPCDLRDLEPRVAFLETALDRAKPREDLYTLGSQRICVPGDPFGWIISFCGQVFCMSASHVVRTLDPQPHWAQRTRHTTYRQLQMPKVASTAVDHTYTVAARNAS